MSALRKLTLRQPLQGFFYGLIRGMDSTNDAFEAPVVKLRAGPVAGLQLDVEAIRADVGRSNARITRELAKFTRGAETS